MISNKKALQLFASSEGGILKTSQAISLGIHPKTLYSLVKNGSIFEVTRGFYRLESLGPLTEPDLVTVALRSKKAVICLISALSIHEITTQIPHEVNIALPRDIKPPTIAFPPLKAFHFSKANYEAGIETRSFDGIKIKVYDIAKTVIDCFRLSNYVGLDVAIEALKLCRETNKCNAHQLMKYARIAKISNKVRPYIQQEFS